MIGPCRAMLATSEALYAVMGTGVYRISKTFVATHYSSAGVPGTGPCKLVCDGTYLSICNGERLYVLKLGDGTFTNVRQAMWIDYIDTYIVAPNFDSVTWSCSYNSNPLTWNAADYGAVIGRTGNVVSIGTLNRAVYIFGNQATELWVDVGGADFPFARTQPGLVEIGCTAPASVTLCNEALFFLDNERRVTAMSGSSWKVMSPNELNRIFNQYPNPEDAVGWSFTMDGRPIYMITFYEADATWIYDTGTGSWFKWGSKRQQAFAHAFRGSCPVNFAGKIICGDRYTSTGTVGTDSDVLRIYELTPEVFTDDGDEISRVRTMPPITSDGKRFQYSRFELEMDTGHSPAGDDPHEVLLDWSDDNGHTWSNPVSMSVGALGAYQNRVKWFQLGSGYNRMFRKTMTDKSYEKIYSCSIDATPGTH